MDTAPFESATSSDKVNHDLYLPAIQREFAWGTDRIERLFDPIMADFPIGSFLFWRLEQKNKDEWPVYEFIRDFDGESPHNPAANMAGITKARPTSEVHENRRAFPPTPSRSEIPLTVPDASRLVTRIMDALRTKFRVRPRQARSKPFLAKLSVVQEAVLEGFTGPMLKTTGDRLPTALRSLLESKRVATVLYQRFRSESIHGAKVLVDETRFLDSAEPYWSVESSPYFGDCLLIEFPARFLLATLRNCLKTFRPHILAKGKLAPDIWFHVFGEETFQFLEFLDQDLLPPERSLKFRYDS